MMVGWDCRMSTLQLFTIWPFMPHFLHTIPWQQFLAMWPSCPKLKQLIILVTSVSSVTSVNSFTSHARVWGNFSLLLHLLAVWPNLLHLWHLKRGPTAPEFSRTERMAPSSLSDISMAWDKRMDSLLLWTIVWILSLWRPCIKQALPKWFYGSHCPFCLFFLTYVSGGFS